MITPEEWREAPVAAREAECFTLICKGLTFEKAASVLGYAGKQGAYDSYRRALKKKMEAEPSEERAADAERLDVLIKAHMRLAVHMIGDDDGMPMIPAVELTDRIVKLMARRAALLGIDAPAKLAPTSPDGKQPYQLTAAAPDARTATVIMAALASLAAGGVDGADKAGELVPAAEAAGSDKQPGI